MLSIFEEEKIRIKCFYFRGQPGHWGVQSSSILAVSLWSCLSLWFRRRPPCRRGCRRLLAFMFRGLQTLRVLGYGSQLIVLLLPSSLSLQRQLCFCSWWKLQARVTSWCLFFFFFPLFIWKARLTVSPIVYLAPLSHPFPGNPKHRKPASSVGPKGDSRQHRALGTLTKESHAQHRQHIQFLWFSSSSSFNTYFFWEGSGYNSYFLAKSWRWLSV